jgi:hypothetical protein
MTLLLSVAPRAGAQPPGAAVFTETLTPPNVAS